MSTAAPDRAAEALRAQQMAQAEELLFSGPQSVGFAKALSSPRIPWLVTAAVLAIASCMAPLTLAGASTGTRVALASMHVIAAVCIAGNLSRLAMQR